MLFSPPLACSASSRSVVARPLARRGTSAAQKKQQASQILCRRRSSFTKTMPPNKPTAAGANAAAASNGAAAASGAADGGSKKKSQEEHTAADYYFDSYSHFGIHEEMLKDSVRTRTYQAAIENNPFLFKDKVVLDVGCGTGILSLFAARAGAKHVYGVECSAIADQARQIIEDNGYANKITVIKQKVEEIERLPDGVEKVDIIISEWMGYFLLYESMLDSVIYARDRWLAPGGLMLPDKATLYVCAIEDADYRAEKIDFWDNVYGFDFRSIKRLAMAEPLVDTVDPEQVATESAVVRTFDIAAMTKEDAAFSSEFELRATRNDYVHALVAYFDVTFGGCHKSVGFSTGPGSRPTHWKQTVLYLDEPVVLCAGEKMQASLRCAPNAGNPRDLDIELEYRSSGARGAVGPRKQSFRMR